MFVHGEKDDVVYVENSIRMYEAAHEPKYLYIIKNCGHANLLKKEPDEFEQRMLEFFDTALSLSP